VSTGRRPALRLHARNLPPDSRIGTRHSAHFLQFVSFFVVLLLSIKNKLVNLFLCWLCSTRALGSSQSMRSKTRRCTLVNYASHLRAAALESTKRHVCPRHRLRAAFVRPHQAKELHRIGLNRNPDTEVRVPNEILARRIDVPEELASNFDLSTTTLADWRSQNKGRAT